MASDLKSTTIDKVHKEILGQVSDSYQKTEGFPTWDLLKAAAFGIKKIWDKLFMIEYRQDVDNLTGTDLERFIYQRKGLSRKAATYATGAITIVVGTGVVDPSCVFSTEGGIEFKSLETKNVTSGDTVLVQALTAGASGNVSAGLICQMPVTIAGIAKITNENPTADGYEAEDDDSLRERYYNVLREPATSGNVAHYRRWAREVEGVGHVKVFPLWQGDNTVQVVIADDNGLVPSEDTVARCQAYIDPNRAGTGMGEAPVGAYCTVTAAEPLYVKISVTLQIDDTKTLEQIREELEAKFVKYFESIVFNYNYVSLAKIGSIILDQNGVSDYDHLLLNGGTDRLTIPDKSIAVLGSVVLNE